VPARATKRGSERTPLETTADVLICGASFAGLAAARALAGSGAKVLVIDRYAIGERATSACAAPTGWLERLGLDGSIRQTFGELVMRLPRGTLRFPLPYTFSTFDYAGLCELLARQGDFAFETATVRSIARGPTHTVTTDRGPLRAPLVLDALGWRRVLASDGGFQPPEAPLTRGLEVHPPGASGDLEVLIDPRYARAGYAWSFPAQEELRVGVCSYAPRTHVKGPTVALASERGLPAVRYQGNWIPHALRPAADDGVFFAGDSAGHCLPLTAEGIRTAFYFGLAAGRALRTVVEGHRRREDALADYAHFSAEHARQYARLGQMQRAIGRLNGRGPLLGWGLGKIAEPARTRSFFLRYLALAPPEFADQHGPLRRVSSALPFS
jgi:flavin-dependent dehydrogenase